MLKKKNQTGFTLIELALALSISILVLTSLLYKEFDEFRQNQARAYGRQIAQHTVATRAAMVVSGPAMVATGSPKTGVNWLKANDGTCPGGAATQPFLACTFSQNLLFGVNLGVTGTAVASNGAAPNPTYSGVTVFPGVTDSVGNPMPVLTMIARNAAERYDDYNTKLNTTGGSISYQAFLTAGNYISPVNGANVPVAANTIVAIAVADAGSDIYLRLNGTNKMLGNIDMNNNRVIAARDVSLQGALINGSTQDLSKAVTFSGVFATGSVIPKPTCTASAPSTQIFVSPIVFHANGSPMYGSVARAIDNGGSWTVVIESMNKAGAMINAGRASVLVKCS